jgi:bifunctional DNA-binding transcriptional regulator/antitoxin component of YhaV-PrlF toxin-antitoxin module
MQSTLSSRGQTAVPAKIRKKFHLEPQSRLEWLITGDVLTVIPIPKDPIRAFRGSLKGRYTGEKFLKDRRQDRERERQRK